MTFAMSFACFALLAVQKNWSTLIFFRWCQPVRYPAVRHLGGLIDGADAAIGQRQHPVVNAPYDPGGSRDGFDGLEHLKRLFRRMTVVLLHEICAALHAVVDQAFESPETLPGLFIHLA